MRKKVYNDYMVKCWFLGQSGNILKAQQPYNYNSQQSMHGYCHPFFKKNLSYHTILKILLLYKKKSANSHLQAILTLCRIDGFPYWWLLKLFHTFHKNNYDPDNNY